MLVGGEDYRTVWMQGSTVKMIDQVKIPHEFGILELNSTEEVAHAIKNMHVRGAGAIGATAAYAIAQIALNAPSYPAEFESYVLEKSEIIRRTRPTAQNLFYGVQSVLDAIISADAVEDKRRVAMEAAQKVADEDASNCKRIGEHGSELIRNGTRILTHCNAGWLAFVDWGSALSPLYVAKRRGLENFVYVDETRPLLQGSRLTAWELLNEKIPHAIITDSSAGSFMREGLVDLVIVGADRIAANGDVANKIGTYPLAVLAKENNVDFYVAAPSTTVDFSTETGSEIIIEERHEDEIHNLKVYSANGFVEGRVSAQSNALNRAFDVTPSKYIKGIITESGIFHPNKLKSSTD